MLLDTGFEINRSEHYINDFVITGDPAEECCEACENYPDCVAFVILNQGSFRCVLFNGYITLNQGHAGETAYINCSFPGTEFFIEYFPCNLIDCVKFIITGKLVYFVTRNQDFLL